MKQLLFLLGWAGAMSAHGQTIDLRDGKQVVAKSIRLQGSEVYATVDLPTEAGQPPHTGELGYPVAKIARVTFPRPPQLQAAEGAIAQGHAADALTQLDPVIRFYQPFADLPGSWWPAAMKLKLQALFSLERQPEVEATAREVAGLAQTPEMRLTAQAYQLPGLIQRNETDQALQASARILAGKEADSSARAMASIAQGDGLLLKKDWEKAALSFASVPVWYPLETGLLPRAAIGRARAEIGMVDFPHAKTTLQEVQKAYASTPAAALAQTELDRIARLEKAQAPQ